ncbi:MAG: HemK2/MTQ2 family protein methyltransferase [Candidatus Hodarchaeota archaeon]
MEFIPGNNSIKLLAGPDVYSPQEDTWFLTDVLKRYFQDKKIKKNSSFLVCEVGVGTGFISILLGREYPNLRFVGIDISPQATALCWKNMSVWLKPQQFNLICADLFQALNPLKFSPKIVFFNPPYVRTRTEELKRKNSLSKAWVGGSSGVVIIQVFLETLTNFHFDTAFFLSSIFNENELFEKNYSCYFHIEIIAEKKVESERLLCYKVKHK